MPPKKAAEAPPPPEAPDQAPTFDSDTFVDEMLLKAKRRELEALENGVAAAVGMLDDYKINLRRGIVVDFVVECVLFASQHNFNARKTAAFVAWMSEMRQSIETTGDVEQAKTMFKTHAVAQAERASLASSAAADNADGDAASAPAAAAKPAPKGGKAAAGKAAARPEAEEKPRTDASVLLTVADMGHVADFVVCGILQHWRLYHHAATFDIAGANTSALNVSVQTPMRPPALIRALPQDQYQAQQESLRKKAEEELAALQAKEEAEREEERERLEREAEEARLAAEEAEANTLYFEKHGTDKIVANVHDEVQSELAQKQASVAARLARIEELLHLTANSS